MTQWIARKLGADVPLHFTAFHPDWKMLDNAHAAGDAHARSAHRTRERSALRSIRGTYTTTKVAARIARTAARA